MAHQSHENTSDPTAQINRLTQATMPSSPSTSKPSTSRSGDPSKARTVSAESPTLLRRLLNGLRLGIKGEPSSEQTSPTTTTTSGPTSADVRVTGELIERYEATLTLPRAEAADHAVNVCAARATAWATMHGVEIELHRIDRPDTNAAGEVCCVTPEIESVDVGVAWSIVVGKGSSSYPMATYPEITTGIGWNWSARWKHWLGWFGSMRAAERGKDELAAFEEFMNRPVPMPDGVGRPDGAVFDLSPQDSTSVDSDSVALEEFSELQLDLLTVGMARTVTRELREEHRKHLWLDRHNDVWSWDSDWDVWDRKAHAEPRDDWEAQTPRREFGPFVQLLAATEAYPTNRSEDDL